MNEELNYLSFLLSVILKRAIALQPTNTLIKQEVCRLKLNNGSIICIAGYGLLAAQANNWVKFCTDLSISEFYHNLAMPALTDSAVNDQTVYRVFDTRQKCFLGVVALAVIGSVPKCPYLNILPITINCQLSAEISALQIQELKEKSIIVNQFALYSRWIKNGSIFYLRYQQSKLVVLKRDSTMEDKLNLSIKLGILEISLNDFLQLQEGSEIEIKNLIPTQVLAEIGGIGWAQAEITYTESNAKLKITKLLKAA